MKTYENEISMYEDIIKSISNILEFRGYKFRVFRTWKEFDPYLKERYTQVIAVLQKDVLPDIMVLYGNTDKYEKTLIIEVKINSLIVKDIAQAKMYCDVFNADALMLVSCIEVRNAFKDFYKLNNNFLKCNNGTILHTCVLLNSNLQIQNCFPNDGGCLR